MVHVDNGWYMLILFVHDFLRCVNNISEKMKEAKEYSMLVIFITDIMKKGSYLLYCENSKRKLQNAMDIDEIYQGIFMQGILSRKKQIVPKIMKIV